MNEEMVGSKLKYKLNFCLLTKKKTVKEKCEIKKEGKYFILLNFRRIQNIFKEKFSKLSGNIKSLILVEIFLNNFIILHFKLYFLIFLIKFSNSFYQIFY